MSFIVEQFKIITGWITPRSKAKDIIDVLEQVACGNFDYIVKAPQGRNDEHDQILKGLKITLSELKKLDSRGNTRRKQLLEANGKLRELDQRKREFMELASHQLKTPLASMEIGLDLLAKKAKNWKLEESLILNDVRGSYVRLSKLVRSLLAAVRIEDKVELEPNFKRVKVQQIIEVLFTDFKPNFEIKGIEFKVNNEVISLVMKTDPEFVIDILQNLLENSLQYTDTGVVSLDVTTQNGRVDFVVSDTGVGVPTSDQTYVFDKLYRGSNVKDKAEHGTGLGLYYTRQLVKKLKGKIRFDSTPNEGTVFMVSLPINLI